MTAVLSPPQSTFTLDDLGRCRPSAAELRRAISRVRAKAILIALLGIGSYLGLVLVADGLLLGLPLAALLVVAVIATGTCVMHDANHGAFGGSRRFNRVVGYSADVIGASSWLWRQKHNVLHHGNTNVVGIDTDIEQLPFARLAPGQPWKPWHRYQHLYLWPLYGLLTIQWVLMSDVVNLITRRIGSQPLPHRPRRRDVAMVLSGKAIHLSWAFIVPLAFHRSWTVLAFYLGCSWLVGFVLAVFFQVAHCVDTTGFAVPSTPRRGEEFASHQLRTTADVDCRGLGRPVGWLMGGLHHQVEHHLAPGLPHTAYPAMAERVRLRCLERGELYRIHPSMGAALRSHARWLRRMGRRPTARIAT